MFRQRSKRSGFNRVAAPCGVQKKHRRRATEARAWTALHPPPEGRLSDHGSRMTIYKRASLGAGDGLRQLLVCELAGGAGLLLEDLRGACSTRLKLVPRP
jgi:hypothetical protein